MTEIYLHFIFSHYGLYANAPVDDDREFVSSVCALLVLCHCRTAGVPREAGGMNFNTFTGQQLTVRPYVSLNSILTYFQHGMTTPSLQAQTDLSQAIAPSSSLGAASMDRKTAAHSSTPLHTSTISLPLHSSPKAVISEGSSHLGEATS